RGPARRCEVVGAPGAWTIAPEIRSYTVVVRATARVFAIQSERQRCMSERGGDESFPRPVTIPVGELGNGTGPPLYIAVIPPPWGDGPGQSLWEVLIDKCTRCLPCCVGPVAKCR